MPYQQMPQFKSVPDKMFELPQPGMGGLNLKDLEYEQDASQSPYMLNMMYRNGAFSKRYGQEILLDVGDEIWDSVYYDGLLFLNVKEIDSGTEHGEIYVYDGIDLTVLSGDSIPSGQGLFMIFNQKLYYFNGNGYENPIYEISLHTTSASSRWMVDQLDPYVPDVFINCEPNVNEATCDKMEDFNILVDAFREVYNGDGTTKDYYIYDDDKVVDWSQTILEDISEVYLDDVLLNGEKSGGGNYNDYEFVKVDKKHYVRFHIEDSQREINTEVVDNVRIPAEGNMNVVVKLPIKEKFFKDTRAQIFSTKFYACYGGRSDSRVFIGGNGKGKVFWSDIDDITYFPENNWMLLGNSEYDISGLARQYNILVAFKPDEVYSIYSYIQDSSNSLIEGEFGLENFKSQLINDKVGCNCPYTIQLINNFLTWFNTKEGICTLVSTNVQDERNVRVISRNIERTNNFDVKGILDYTEDPMTIQSADFDSKYFLVFPESGHCFMWDYEISPYRCTSNGETNPAKLDWFLFDHFYVKKFQPYGHTLLYISSDTVNAMVELNNTFNDLDFDEDGEDDPIDAYYMTPFLQFGAVESLKNVKNIYVQCRGDFATEINMWYFDEENLNGELEPEPIVINSRIWQWFKYATFAWYAIGRANTFRRKCNLKKVQMAAFMFRNNSIARNLSITHLGIQYQIVKYVR